MTLKLHIGILACLAPVSVQAQPELSVAAKSGLSISDVTSGVDDGDGGSSHYIYGFSGGLASYVQWPFTSRFSLGGQLDLLYTQRGFDLLLNGEPIGRNRYHYFDVAIVVRPEVRVGAARGYALLGGGWNLLLTANQEDLLSNMADRDITKFLRRHDVALVVGAGVAIQLPHQPLHLDTLFLEARHDRGLINTPTDRDANKNRSGSLMLGLSFALGSRPE